MNEYLRQCAYGAIEYPEWARISSEYYYHFVADSLRKRLDSFYRDIQRYNGILTHLGSDVNQLITREATAFYNKKDLREITLGILTGPGQNDFSPTVITNAIIFEKDPREMPQFPSYSYIPNPRFAALLQVKNEQGGFSIEALSSLEDLKRFDAFLARTTALAQKLQVVRDTQQLVHSLLGQSKELQDSILQLIQKPWLS